LTFGDIEGNFHIVTVPQSETGSGTQSLTDIELYESIRMTITKNGDVGIGTTDCHGYKLAVKGKVLCEEVKIQLEQDWPDYVFNIDHPLLTLYEIEEYIKENNKLPDMPSANEVKKDGVNLGELNVLLVKKIEELTKYIIEQQKQIDELKNLLRSER
jgi:predicted RNA-binding protein with TRAM domain